MHDVSVSHPSCIIADCFKFSHLVFASPTYNGGVFVNMENLLHDLAAHSLSSRKLALIESGSWAISAGKGMREILAPLKNCEFILDTFSFRSALGQEGEAGVNLLAEAIAASINQ
jgi:flavorubredoxin